MSADVSKNVNVFKQFQNICVKSFSGRFKAWARPGWMGVVGNRLDLEPGVLGVNPEILSFS